MPKHEPPVKVTPTPPAERSGGTGRPPPPSVESGGTGRPPPPSPRKP